MECYEEGLVLVACLSRWWVRNARSTLTKEGSSQDDDHVRARHLDVVDGEDMYVRTNNRHGIRSEEGVCHGSAMTTLALNASIFFFACVHTAAAQARAAPIFLRARRSVRLASTAAILFLAAVFFSGHHALDLVRTFFVCLLAGVFRSARARVASSLLAIHAAAGWLADRGKKFTGADAPSWLDGHSRPAGSGRSTATRAVTDCRTCCCYRASSAIDLSDYRIHELSQGNEQRSLCSVTLAWPTATANQIAPPVARARPGRAEDVSSQHKHQNVMCGECDIVSGDDRAPATYRTTPLHRHAVQVQQSSLLALRAACGLRRWPLALVGIPTRHFPGLSSPSTWNLHCRHPTWRISRSTQRTWPVFDLQKLAVHRRPNTHQTHRLDQGRWTKLGGCWSNHLSH
nr:unnamed protein product [Digitaria exilis]